MEALILIDDNVPPGARGMARYFRYATDGLIAHFGNQVAIFSHIARDYGPATFIRAIRFKGSEQVRLHDRLAGAATRKVRPRVIYSAWFNTLATPASQVFVVYDMIYELFPHYHSWRQVPLRDIALERVQCIERADVILSISHNTAQDLLKIYPGTDPTKIVVTHLGVEPVFFQQSNPLLAASCKPYFLYVGFRTGHKNFARLLEAYGQSGLASQFDLRVISAHPFDSGEVERISHYHVQPDVHLIPHATDAELHDHYAGATALVYPSEYEGFGLPIIEAMASGTLVATSGVSSMPEVGGDVAFYFDPHEVESMLASLRQITGLATSERQQRIEQGIARARTFTWASCQQETVKVLEQLLA